MSKLKLLGAVSALALMAAFTPAKADIVYVLGESNTAGQGPGPYGYVLLDYIDTTHASLTYAVLNQPGFTYTFGEVGANVNSTSFTNTPPVFTLAATSNQTPTYTRTSGNLDGFGNFELDEVANPNGFSSSVTRLSTTLTDINGTWATDADVLTANGGGNFVSTHFFANGNSAFTADTFHCTLGDCPVVTPFDVPGDVPEPASAAIMGSGIIGMLGVLGWKRRKDSMSSMLPA